jgi:hypothetical protein
LVSLDFGFSRNKTPKTFGPVFNVTALLGTGLFVCGTMSCQGDSVKEVDNRMFRRLCQTDTDNSIDFGNSKVASDRAYNGDHYQLLIESFGGCTLNTVKRGSSLPFVFGKVGFPIVPTMRVIPEGGTKTVFYATRRIGRRIQHLTAYRSGTGRVTLLSSTESGREAYMWTLVPKNLCSWRSSLNASCMLERRLQNQDIQTLTQSQRDAAWFALRSFRFTSTTAVVTLRRICSKLVKHSWVNSDTTLLRLLSEDLGLTVRRRSLVFLSSLLSYLPFFQTNLSQDTTEDPREKYFENLSLTDVLLSEKTKRLLGEMLRDFKVPGRTKLLKGTDKVPAARAILAAASSYVPQEEIPEEAEFVRHSFLKPIDKSSNSHKAMDIGKHNEVNVIRNLKKFMEKSHMLHINEDLKEYGLV